MDIINDIRQLLNQLEEEVEHPRPFMRTSYDLVEEFHEAMGHPIDEIDIKKDSERVTAFIELRKRLIREEAKELCDALDARDLEQIIKEEADLDYVSKGTLVALLGVTDPLTGSFLAVHNSNMSKLGDDGKPVYDAGGKVMKGPNYKPPNMKPFVFG